MKVKIVCFLSLILIFSCSNSEVNDLVLINANIIDVNTGEISKGTLTINEGLIVENPKILKAKSIINLEGKYIIPGLWDMHVHIHGNKQKLKQFFNYGVLGVRDMGARIKSNVDSLIKWKQLNNKAIPEIEYAGLFYSDTTCFNGHQHISKFDDVIKSINYTKSIGAKFYKLHNCYPDNLIPILDSLAKKNNIKIVGHIPEGVDILQYIREFDISSIEHISVPIRAISFQNKNPLNMMQAISKFDGSFLDTLAIEMKNSHTAFSPNLLSEKEFLKSYSEEQKPLGEALYDRYKKYTKRFASQGVLILASTDTGLESIEAGKSLHQELELLSEAGLTNLEVIQTATINPMKYLNDKKHINPLELGSNANFVVLNSNPIDNISNTSDIHSVIKNGQFELKSQNKQ
ncbi:amidohydrolase family protein [Psychroserpens sp. MEBiC05023]